MRESPRQLAIVVVCVALALGCSKSSPEPAEGPAQTALQPVAVGPNAGPVRNVLARMRDKSRLVVGWMASSGFGSDCTVNWKYADGGSDMTSVSNAARVQTSLNVDGPVAAVQVLC